MNFYGVLYGDITLLRMKLSVVLLLILLVSGVVLFLIVFGVLKHFRYRFFLKNIKKYQKDVYIQSETVCRKSLVQYSGTEFLSVFLQYVFKFGFQGQQISSLEDLVLCDFFSNMQKKDIEKNIFVQQKLSSIQERQLKKILNKS